MLTLYTAIGSLKLQKNGAGKICPIVINNKQEYALSEHELLLWSCLDFQILQIHELTERYESRCQRQKHAVSSELPYYLNRLLLRGLIAKGDGMTAVDALYRLLGQLYITPLQDSFPVRLFTCIHLYLEGKINCKDFGRYLQKEKFTPLEKTIIELAHTVPLSTAELVTCLDKGLSIQSTEDVLDKLYCDETETYETLAEHAQINHTQYPVLQAIGNLYLNKHISFQSF